MVVNNIFGEIHDRVCTFVIDTSWSMQDMMPIIKRHLQECLTENSSHRPDFKFNIVSSNSKLISRWSDKPVECTPHSVNSAIRWLSDVKCQKNKSLLKAINIAGREIQYGGIYLVLNGVGDEDLREHCFVHPVHCILLTCDKERYPSTEDVFCEDLATLSRGSFHVVFLTHGGNVDRVIEAYNSKKCPADVRTCSIKTSLNDTPVVDIRPVTAPPTVVPVPAYYPYPYCRPYPVVDLLALREELHKTPVASVVARGTRVLARRQDGYYYRGNIAQEIEKSQSAFMVEFDKTKRGPEMRMEEIPLHDIIALHDAERHSIVPGDKVLAQWSNARSRFGPGDVLSGVENRKVIGDRNDNDLVVSFWNGKTEKVNKGEAVWIPGPLYDRIVTELQMPISARKTFTDLEKSTKLTKPVLHDDILEVPFIDPLYRGLYYTWWNRGYYYLPTYPLLTSVPTYLRSWPDILYHQPHLLYERYPWQYYPETVTSYKRYPLDQPRFADDFEDDKNPDVDLDLKKLKIKKHSSSSSSSSSSCSSSSSSDSDDDDKYKDLLTDPKYVRDQGTNTDYTLRSSKRSSFIRKEPEPRPEWKKYWPQTPQPRFHHIHPSRRTWGTEYDSEYQRPHMRGIERDYARSMDIADCKRIKTLMRIRSDLDKQRKYEEQIQRTIDAKSKINQAFRNKFYEKEMDHLNRRNLHQQWLQDRRNRYESTHALLNKAEENQEKLRQLDRQVRQIAHYHDTARNANYDAAVEGKRKTAMVNRRARLLDLESRRY